MTEKLITDFTDDELVTQAGTGMPTKREHAQAELTRRLMESLRTFDKTTSDYSRKLLKLSILLFLVAAMQLLLSAFTLPFSIMNKIVIAVSLVVLLLWILKDSEKK